MSDDATVMKTLRAVRKSDELVDRLKAESLEARRDRIAIALGRDDWGNGPADLLATYPKHALAVKNGVLMRVRVQEDESGKITFDKIEVLDLPIPPTNVAKEVMETALVAVDRIYEDKIEEAEPLVRAIANAIYTSGGLRRKVMTEVARRSIRRDAWWHQVVTEHLAKADIEAETYVIEKVEPEALPAAVESLQAHLTQQAARAAKAIGSLAEAKDAPEAMTAAAKDIAADFKYAIQALEGADRGDPDVLAGVYEGVGAVASQLQAGVRFLENLAGKDGSEE